MGEFLSVPNKEKHSDDGENSFVKQFFNCELAKIRGLWNARMEEKNGRCAYN